MRRHYFLTVTLLSLTLASHANADGLFLNGVSPRSIGRGGTNIAHSDNGAIIFDNPAAMTNIEGHWLKEVAVDVLITDFEYNDAETPRTASSSIGTPLPQFSIIRKSDDGHWAYGLGVFTPAGFSASYAMTGLLGPQSYDSFGSLTKVLPSIAYAPNDRLSVGGSIGVGISHVEFETPYFLQSPGPLQGAPTLLDLQGTGAALIWSAGMQYQVDNSTTIGLTYQSESDFKLDGPASVNVLLPQVGASRYDADTKITWPRSLGFGVKRQVSDRSTFSADIIWFDWSDAFKNITVALNGPTTMGFPPVRETVPLNWSDTVSVRLGHEIDLGDSRTIRFGYVYHRNPIPRSTLTPLIQAITEHGLSTGYGFKVFDVEIDFAYMLTIGKDVNVTNSQFIGGDFNNARHGAVTHAATIGAIKRY